MICVQYSDSASLLPRTRITKRALELDMIRILYFAVIVIALPLERLYGLDISSWWHQLSRQYKKRRELPATIRFYCLKTDQSKVQTSTALFDSTGRGNSNSPEVNFQSGRFFSGVMP